MDVAKQKLLDRIDDDRDLLVDYLRAFIRLRSPNPPGDMLDCSAHVRRARFVLMGDGGTANLEHGLAGELT